MAILAVLLRPVGVEVATGCAAEEVADAAALVAVPDLEEPEMEVDELEGMAD